jgi:hypothetical protein
MKDLEKRLFDFGILIKYLRRQPNTIDLKSLKIN